MELIHDYPKSAMKMRNEKKTYEKTLSNMNDAICLVMKNSILFREFLFCDFEDIFFSH